MYSWFKRACDILISAAALILLSPLLLLTAIAIRIESPGPAIFRQTRLGLGGREFCLYKFRSMCVGAESKGTGQYSFDGDPRVTKIGKFIRKTSIDELPQLVNILKGDMSLIGPRPVLTYHPWKFEAYTEEQKKRFNVRPGITGLAQVNGRKTVEWNKRLEYDVYYTEHMSFSQDLRIFFKTIVEVFAGEDNANVTTTVKDVTTTVKDVTTTVKDVTTTVKDVTATAKEDCKKEEDRDREIHISDK